MLCNSTQIVSLGLDRGELYHNAAHVLSGAKRRKLPTTPVDLPVLADDQHSLIGDDTAAGERRPQGREVMHGR